MGGLHEAGASEWFGMRFLRRRDMGEAHRETGALGGGEAAHDGRVLVAAGALFETTNGGATTGLLPELLDRHPSGTPVVNPMGAFPPPPDELTPRTWDCASEPWPELKGGPPKQQPSKSKECQRL